MTCQEPYWTEAGLEVMMDPLLAPFFFLLCSCQVMMTRTLTSRRMMNLTVNWKRDGYPSHGQPWRCSCKVPGLLSLALLPVPVIEHHGQHWVRAAGSKAHKHTVSGPALGFFRPVVYQDLALKMLNGHLYH